MSTERFTPEFKAEAAKLNSSLPQSGLLTHPVCPSLPHQKGVAHPSDSITLSHIYQCGNVRHQKALESQTLAKLDKCILR